jgi:hypothetical protein
MNGIYSEDEEGNVRLGIEMVVRWRYFLSVCCSAPKT